MISQLHVHALCMHLVYSLAGMELMEMVSSSSSSASNDDNDEPLDDLFFQDAQTSGKSLVRKLT